MATHLQFCYNDWVLIEEKKLKKHYFKSRGHFRLPVCEELPRYDKDSKPLTCSYVGLTEMNINEITCKYFSVLNCITHFLSFQEGKVP